MDAARIEIEEVDGSSVDSSSVDSSSDYQSDESSEDTATWAKRLKEKVDETEWRDDPCTIYKVPHGQRIAVPCAYEPMILSLGPYHHGKRHLKAMDELKWRYLKSFLRRNSKRRLVDYLTLVENMEERTRNAYSEAPQMNSKHWVEMMLLDGCFAIEFLHVGMFGPNKFGGNATGSIQISRWVPPLVLRDMLLLENQLPFFLLKELHTFNSFPNRINHSLHGIVLANFVNLMPGKIELSSVNDISDIHHILHLLYFCILPSNSGMRGETGSNSISNILDEPSPLPGNPGMKGERFNNISSISDEPIPLSGNPTMEGETECHCISIISDKPIPLPWVMPLTNLKDAGVRFRKKTNMASFIGITFQQGTLEIPPLKIIGHSLMLFRNLIAFEQSYTKMDCPRYLAPYAQLMHCIVNTPTDVDMLQKKGVIVNALGNNDEVAQFFNRLCANFRIEDAGYLSGVFTDVQRHCDKRVNRWKASLIYNYLTNPWVIISVIAAIFLFLLTIAQTVLAFLKYFRPHWP